MEMSGHVDVRNNSHFARWLQVLDPVVYDQLFDFSYLMHPQPYFPFPPVFSLMHRRHRIR
jgi:hypothetical protein